VGTIRDTYFVDTPTARVPSMTIAAIQGEDHEVRVLCVTPRPGIYSDFIERRSDEELNKL
jgi:hypothetical protein